MHRYGRLIAMTDPAALRLRQARRAAGFETVADAARYLGVKYPTYAGHENPNSPGTFQTKAAELYARKYRVSLDWLLTGRGEMRGQGVVPAEIEVAGLPILGEIRAGAWLETSFIDAEGEPDMLQVARDPRFPRARQYALRVVGSSMDLDYPDGSYVTCVDFAESGLSIAEGLTVHVERHRQGFVEITLKALERRRSSWWLVPHSSDPVHQPISLKTDDGEVVIRGVVTGGWRQTPIPR
jgi:SOS-response transcriptional repressor LexA